MSNINRVILVGNLTRDPEVKTTNSGTTYAKLGIAINRRWTGKNGEKSEQTDFFDIVVWGKLAELCGEYLSKGRQVAVDGRLSTSSWQTEDGQKRSKVEVVAENVQFLGGGRGDQAQQGGSYAAAAAAGTAAGAAANDIYDDSIGEIELGGSIDEEVPF